MKPSKLPVSAARLTGQESTWLRESGPAPIPMLPRGQNPPPWSGQSATEKTTGLPAGAARRFTKLSSLPEDQRIPRKRGVVSQKHLRATIEPSGPDAPVRSLALTRPPPLPPPVPVVQPVMLPAPVQQQLGFNCPACFTVLIIKDPSTYDGQPAPCPSCASRILPPRIVPDEIPFRAMRQISGPPRHELPAGLTGWEE